ncbi:hypothetical protein CR157_05505 [Halomonas sp. LBP4]|nr:hypothetical protein CR157_05505 [Halomonas sp. LBP4]
MAKQDEKRRAGTTVDLDGENVHWDQAMSYGQYLNLEAILPRTCAASPAWSTGCCRRAPS